MAEAPPGGAAAEAGIVPGDVVLAVDGRPVASGADLAAKIGSIAPGAAAKITIFRDGSEHTLSVRLGELPVTPFKAAAEPQQQKPSALGLSLAPVANSQGVTITDVDPDGLGAEKGLAVGDIILDVSNHPVHTPSDIHNAMSSKPAPKEQIEFFFPSDKLSQPARMESLKAAFRRTLAECRPGSHRPRNAFEVLGSEVLKLK